MENFINRLEYDGTVMVKRIKQTFLEDRTVSTLKCQLAFIAANSSFLPEAIEKLQTRMPLAEA